MKVGGNESATKYFQSHGGSAALQNKDAKAKYTHSTATKYKDELKRRAAADAKEHPDEVVIVDSLLSPTIDEPAAGNEDDFFSSWDKPAIKRPSNPPSRTATPGISRTASPFLNGARAKTPLAGEGEAAKAPAAARTTSSAIMKKSAAAGAAKKTNILGAKKTQKLGVKKVTAGDDIDFDAAEKAAKEEADRIAKLGYDPNAEEETKVTVASPTAETIAAPTPVNPANSFSTNKPASHQRSASELERLGMGMGRLGFGQVGGAKKAAAAPKRMGFGAVGGGSSAAKGKQYWQASTSIGSGH